MKVFRVLTGPYWTARAVVQGRIFYADGRSEKVDRASAWASYRPYPAFWLKRRAMRLTPGHIDQRECGCSYWFGRHQGWCVEHLRAHCLERRWGEGSRS